MHATIRAGPRGPAAARPPPTGDNHPVRRRASSLPFRPAAKKPGFGDELLDFVLAGRKMRKWYGQEGFGEGLGEGGDFGGGEEEGGGGVPGQEGEEQPPPPPPPSPPPPSQPRTAVAVFGADGPTGEATMTALILAGAPDAGGLAALGSRRRGEAAGRELRAAWGAYASAGTAPAGDGPGSAAALGRAAVLVLPDSASVAAGLAAAAAAGVPRVVALVGEGAGGGGGWLGGLLGSGGSGSGPAPPSSLASASIPVTAVIALGGALRDAPGGASSLALAGGVGGGFSAAAAPTPTRPLARGDAAAALAAAALAAIPEGASAWIAVADGGDGAPPPDWGAAVGRALKKR